MSALKVLTLEMKMSFNRSLQWRLRSGLFSRYARPFNAHRTFRNILALMLSFTKTVFSLPVKRGNK
jgi:hypothetical protein